jgi:hypothetical protein
MAVELGVEGEEAVEVAALGIQSSWRLVGGFRDEGEVCEPGEMVFGGLNEGCNVMGWIQWQPSRQFLTWIPP